MLKALRTDHQSDSHMDSSYVYEIIKERIAQRELLPGEKINQNQLALELGVSRTPVINALHMLKAGGILDNTPNKGFYVHDSSLQETLELYEIRQAVETIAVAGVVEHAAIEDIRGCSEMFLPFLHQNSIDLAEYARVDRVFHSKLIELSQNSMLLRVNQSILLLPRLFSSGFMRSPKHTIQGHIDISNALVKRDAELAKKLTYEHLGRSLKVVKDAVNGLRKIGLDPHKITVSDCLVNSILEIKD